MRITKATAVPLVFGASLLFTTVSEAVYTRGGASCGVWMRERAENSMMVSARRMWIAGYLSGMAVSTEKDVFPGTDTDSIDLWIDKYCRENPLAHMVDAVTELFWELAQRKR